MNYQELREIVEKDQEIKKMKLSDFELMTAYRYLKMKKSNENPNFIPTLKKTEDTLEIFMMPSVDLEKVIKKREAEANVLSLDTVNFLLDASLDEFILNTEERKQAYLKADNFINSLRENKYTKGLYLYGIYGSGKTYLLSAIVEEVAKFKKVLFVYFPDLVRNLKTSISTNELEDKVTALKTCDLLVFDDVGSENMTGWFRDEVLSPILQFRLASGLPILISSNFSQKQLIDFMATDRVETDRNKAARIVHRIRELTDEVPLTAPFRK
jgi:primosomal protein DnaI